MHMVNVAGYLSSPISASTQCKFGPRSFHKPFAERSTLWHEEAILKIVSASVNKAHSCQRCDKRHFVPAQPITTRLSLSHCSKCDKDLFVWWSSQTHCTGVHPYCSHECNCISLLARMRRW
jgi:hypothetical protein